MFFTLLNHCLPGAGDELQNSKIRLPAVSGKFYPSDPEKLTLAIRRFLQESDPFPMDDPVAVIVPHAAFVFSGQVTADAFRQVINRGYEVFVILGVNHTIAGFHGVSVADYDFYHTPLGDIPIAADIAAALLSECRDCFASREVHHGEHSIEVQIPFIQVLFPKAKIVPVIIHPSDPELCTRFGKVLAEVLKGKKALIVISSDLSHYPSSVDARRTDRTTLETIAHLDPERIISIMRNLDVPKLGTRACGEAAILSGITAAKILGAKRAVIAGYSNSGETVLGDRSQAVGYGAVVLAPGDTPCDTHILHRPEPPETAPSLENPEKQLLLAFARKTIQQYLETDTVPLPRRFPSRLSYRQGAFVTLKKGDLLRGCIGNLLPDDELGRTVGRMALQAAINDPRFEPVRIGELADLEIEISVLTPMKSVEDPNRIVVGRDGVYLSKGGKSAVFLPQVAPEQNWSRTEMLEHLCMKALLPSNCWKKNAELKTFHADVFSERQFAMDSLSRMIQELPGERSEHAR